MTQYPVVALAGFLSVVCVAWLSSGDPARPPKSQRHVAECEDAELLDHLPQIARQAVDPPACDLAASGAHRGPFRYHGRETGRSPAPDLPDPPLPGTPPGPAPPTPPAPPDHPSPTPLEGPTYEYIGYVGPHDGLVAVLEPAGDWPRGDGSKVAGRGDTLSQRWGVTRVGPSALDLVSLEGDHARSP